MVATSTAHRVSLRDRLATAARGQAVLTAGTTGTSFISQVILARTYGPEGLGEYAATTVFVAALTALVTLGAPYAISQRAATLDESRDPRALELRGAVAMLALTLAVVAAGVALAGWTQFAGLTRLRSPSGADLIAAAAASAVVLHATTSYLIGHFRMYVATGLYLLQPLAVIAGTLLFGRTLIAGSTLAAAGFVAAGIGATAVAILARAWPRPNVPHLSALANGAVHAAVLPYQSFVTSWLDRGVVGAVAGPVALGWWATATNLTDGVLRLPRTAAGFGVPAYARLSTDVVGIRRVMDSQVRLLIAFVLISAATIVAGAPGIIVALYGEEFALGTTALQVLAITMIPVAVTQALTGGAVGTQRTARSLVLLLWLAPIQLVGAVSLTSVFSIAGTAIAGAVTWTVGVLLLLAIVRDRPPVLTGVSLLRTLTLVVGVSAIALMLGRSVTSVVAVPIAAAVALAGSQAVLIRGPESRLLGQFLRRPGRLLERSSAEEHSASCPSEDR